MISKYRTKLQNSLNIIFLISLKTICNYVENNIFLTFSRHAHLATPPVTSGIFLAAGWEKYEKSIVF